MRTNALRGMIAGLCLFLAAGAAQAGGITWEHSYTQALSRAKQTQKLIMIDFYADWCGWCKKLDQTTYQDPKVVNLSRQFITVKLNSDKEGRSQAMKYAVTGLPTILFLNASGEVEGRIGGYLPADNFVQQVQQILQMHRAFPQMVSKFKAHPGDTALASKVIETYMMRGNNAQAAASLDLAVSHAPRGGKGTLGSSCLMIGGAYFQQRQFGKAIPYFRKAVAIGTPDEALRAHMGAAVCYLNQHQPNVAIAEMKTAENTPGASPELKQRVQGAITQVQQEIRQANGRR